MAAAILDKLFDAELYGKLYPDLEAAGLTGPEKLLEHAKTFGVAEGRKISSFVDLKSYSSFYPDLGAAGLTNFEELLDHLQTFGLQEKRRFSLAVDLNFYSSTYSDLGAAGLTSFEQLLEHLQVFGLKEGRRFSRFIDLKFYGENNPDLTAAGLTTPEELLNHLQEFGIKEGRQLAADVDLKAYGARYGDLQAAFGSDWTKLFQHLVEFGFQEGRAYDPNDAPTVAQPMPDATATAGGAINIQLPDGIFADPDAVDAPTLTATLEDGSPLPSWLTFDPETLTFSGTPPTAADGGTLTIKVTLTDVVGATASNTFALQVAGGTGGTDAGTTPAGSDTGGSDTATTPAGSDTGGSDTATTPPGSGTSGSDTGTTPPAGGTETPPPTPPANNPPVAGAIASQIALPGADFTFTVPASTFSDPDGDALTYTAGKDDGTPLPSWLTFNPDTLTFSGTPGPTDQGTVNIRVAAIDPLSQTATATFTLDIGTNLLPDQTATEDAAFTYTLPENAFGAVDPANPLAYKAVAVDASGNPVQLPVDANGDGLPDWLSFDPATRTFSGTPRNQYNNRVPGPTGLMNNVLGDDVGTVNIQVSATNAAGANFSDTFALTVTNVNDQPILNIDNVLSNQIALTGVPFTFDISQQNVAAGQKSPFLDADAGDALTYTVTNVTDNTGNPASLPSWLSLDAATGTFSGTLPAGDPSSGKVFNITVTATDSSGASTSDTFTLAADTLGTVKALFTAYEEALTNPQSPGVLQLMTENATWNIAGDPNRIPFATTYTGQDIQTYFGRLLANYFPIDPTPPTDNVNGFEPLEFLPSPDDPNKFAVRVRQQGVGAQTGKFFDTDWTYLVTVDPTSGKVSAVEASYNTYALASISADRNAPAIPSDDPLTGKPAAIDPAADEATALQVAKGMWGALIGNNFNPTDPNSVISLSDPNVTWSFAVGGPSFLPYVGAATGLQNAGDELLSKLGAVVAPGRSFDLVNSFADGNRVLLHYRETGARAIETGNTYDLDLFSWMTVENGKVKSNQVIVDTYKTVQALRPDALFPLSPSPAQTRHAPPYFVTASQINSALLAFDENAKFIGVLGQANNGDTDEFVGPIGLTYGHDGKVYVNAGIRRSDLTILNAVLQFDGVSGEFLGGDPRNGYTGDRLGGVTDAFGDADGQAKFLDPVTGQLTPPTIDPTTGQPAAGINPATGLPYPVPMLLIPTGMKFGPDPENPGEEDLYVVSGFTSRIVRFDGKTGAFQGFFAERNNGLPGNVINPASGPPDLTVFVFGPDGHIYVCSARSDPDENPANGEGAILRFVGPGKVGPNGEAPGTLIGLGTHADEGIYGAANNADSYWAANNAEKRLSEASALAFGPDLDLYVASALNGAVLRYAGPTKANAGSFLGVYADVEKDVRARRGGITNNFALSGMGFTPEGDLLVGSSFRTDLGAPVAGSEFSRYSGPLSATPGQYLGAYGDVTTEISRLTNPTTPEFVFDKNSFLEENTPEKRFDRISFVAGVNIDTAAGQSASDGADVLAAFDKDGKFLKYLGEEPAGQNNIPLDGIGGAVLSTEGQILVASKLTNQVLAFDSLNGEYVGPFGQLNGSTAFNGTPLNSPAGLALGSNNDLYVVDQGNARVLRFQGFTGAFDSDDTNQDGIPNGVAVTANPATDRLTSIAFGPDGRIYVAVNPATPGLGQAQVRAYNPNTGQQEVPRSITGLDYVSGLDFGPDGRLYINDNPSEVKDPLTGRSLDPAKESRLLVYNVDSVHPLTDAPTLANSLTLGVGNSSGVNVAPDNTILVTNAAAGSITRYDANLQLIGSAITPALPSEALALDADGLARTTSPLYIAERFY